MKLRFSHKNALVASAELSLFGRRLTKEIAAMQNVKGYDDDRASISLPDDKSYHQVVRTMVNEKMRLKPSLIVVVGIGGSNLGTIAVQEAVLGKLYNQLNPKVKILYADTVDSGNISSVVQLVDKELSSGGRVMVNVVSKSGTTTETIANFEVLLGVLMKHKKDYRKYVVATTDRESKLWGLAQEKGFATLEIPEKVGGRYSVFSAVGLFPLGMLGIDTGKLLKGASDMEKLCLHDDPKKNPAAISAIVHYDNYKKRRRISDTFLFGNDLESVGKWYRQLMGESLGKEGKGITPTFSVGSTDLHSVGQLYLGGPRDKLTTFISVGSVKKVKVPSLRFRVVTGVEGNDLSGIMEAILSGVKAAYRKSKLPYMEIKLHDLGEEAIGALMQMKMIEMMYLGCLLKVNPFNQPDVESYKKETRRLLRK